MKKCVKLVITKNLSVSSDLPPTHSATHHKCQEHFDSTVLFFYDLQG